MIYDSLGSLPPPMTFDVNSKKNPETEYSRAIEDSDKSNDTKLDSKRQNITMSPSGKDMSKDIDVELETYNNHGNFEAPKPSENPMDYQQKSIDLVI